MGNQCIKDIVLRHKCTCYNKNITQPLLPSGPMLNDVDIFIALADIPSTQDGYLALSKGDKIQIQDKQNDPWRGVNLSTKMSGLLVLSDKMVPFDVRKEYIDVHSSVMAPAGKVYQALQDVNAPEEGHLSFKEGEKIQVVGKEQTFLWRGRTLKTNEEGYFQPDKVRPYDTLKEYRWYFGGLKRVRAEQLLLRMGVPGTFMIRISESVPTDFSLSLRDVDSIKHYRIKSLLKDNDVEGYYIRDKCVFANLDLLVKHYEKAKDGLARKLAHPCPVPSSEVSGNHLQDQWETSRDRIQRTIKLDDGHFGEVWQGIWNQSIPVAVKMLKSGEHDNKEDRDRQKEAFLAEANIMKRLSHPKLVRLYAVCTTNEPGKEEPIYIVLELMSKGNLSKYLKSKDGRKLSFCELEKMTGQIAEGMKYLSANKIIHRDLAARNILLADKNIVKIADFGLSKILEDDLEHVIENGDFKVATRWAAPEAHAELKFSIKSDVWSFGIVMYELACKGAVPENVVEITRDQFNHIPDRPRADHYFSLMQQCWNVDADKRPTFDELYVELSPAR